MIVLGLRWYIILFIVVVFFFIMGWLGFGWWFFGIRLSYCCLIFGVLSCVFLLFWVLLILLMWRSLEFCLVVILFIRRRKLSLFCIGILSMRLSLGFVVFMFRWRLYWFFLDVWNFGVCLLSLELIFLFSSF